MDRKTNGATHQVSELIEVARALSEGDFERKLESGFQGELGQLATYIETLQNNLKAISPRFAFSAHLIPKAGQGVAEISHQAEMSVNSILSLVDEMCLEQDAATEMLGKVANGEAAALDIGKLQDIATTTSAKLMSLMSFLSFQDVVRQRAEKVQAMIEMVDEKIQELLTKFNVHASDTPEEDDKAPGEVGIASSVEEVDQSSIDDLFK